MRFAGLLYLLGVGLVVAAAALLHVLLGLFVGGVACLVTARLLVRPGTDEGSE